MSVWRGGRLWGAFAIGLPAGVLFGGLEFADGERSAGAAIVAGAVFGVFIGALLSNRSWSSWPGAKDLASRDRLTVAQAVKRGEGVQEPSLAPSVIEYAAVMTRQRTKERRNWWVLLIFLAITLALAIIETDRGSTRGAVAFGAFVLFWVVLLALMPWRSRRGLEHARRADAAARLLSDQNDQLNRG